MNNAAVIHYELTKSPSPQQWAEFLGAVDDVAVGVNLRRLLVRHVNKATTADGGNQIAAHLIAPLTSDSSIEATILAQFTLLPGKVARRKDDMRGRTLHEIVDFLNVGIVDTLPNGPLGSVSSVLLSSAYYYRAPRTKGGSESAPSFVPRKRMPVGDFPADWYQDLVEQIKLAAYRALAFRRYWG